jgi:hypothetical protein
MANIIKIKRGLKADIDKLTLSAGELGVTLDTQELYVGDANGQKQLIKGAAAGVVETATKLETARKIKVSGAATGEASFDGSADATIALTLANSGVTAGSYNKVTVNAKGLVTSAENVVYAIEDITGLQDALDAKAAKTYVDTELGKKVSTDTYNTGMATKANAEDVNAALADKADKTSVYTKDDIDGKVSTLNTAISKKADQSALNTLSGTVSGHTTSITNINTDLAKKANSADVYTKTAADTLLDAKANKADVYTSTYIDTELAKKANSADLKALAKKDKVSKSDLDSSLSSELDAKATTAAMNTALAKKADQSTVENLEDSLTTEIGKKATKATTIAGYGITDAYTKTEVDGMVAGTFHFRGEKSAYNQLPTNAKEGDVWQVGDREYAWDGDSWVELGFNIDLSAYAKSADVAATYATIATVNTKANSADVYTKSQVYTKTEADAAFMTDAEVVAKGYATTSAMNTELAKKANSATTLSGYGITDAYTKTEVNTELAKKANTATSLSGYGITNAYTKTEVDNKVTTINNTLATKLDASSTIDGGTF